MKRNEKIELIGIRNIPKINQGDSLSDFILKSIKENDLKIHNGDIIVIAQSIVSKSLGAIRKLDNILPSEKAKKLSKKLKTKAAKFNLPIKDPSLIQAILDESREIVDVDHVLITETKHGFICADSGIDKSNVGEKNLISLLPQNPDKEAAKIRKEIQNRTNKEIAIIITDSFGRPFRIGSVGVAIGVSGISPLLDKRGCKDLYGKELKTTIVGQIDNIASAAQLIMGETNEGLPVVLIKGYNFEIEEDISINSILRERKNDLFRKKNDERFFKLLRSRRSYKLPFQDKRVEVSLVKECINIARWAPSAHNAQFWRYIIIEKGKNRNDLIDKMNQKLRRDLQDDNKSKKFIEAKTNKTKEIFKDAPILILLCLDRSELEDYPDKERSKNEYLLGVQSVSSSATYLLLALEAKGLAASWYCAPLFANEIVREILNLPKNYDSMAFFTVGYPKYNIEAPKRKKLDTIIHQIE